MSKNLIPWLSKSLTESSFLFLCLILASVMYPITEIVSLKGQCASYNFFSDTVVFNTVCFIHSYIPASNK